jgi:hypothetical protein
MTKIKRLWISLAALLLFSCLAVVAPVSAREVQEGSSDKPNVTANPPRFAVPEPEKSNSHDMAEQFKAQAEQKVQEDRQKIKEQTQAEREKSCSARKTSLTHRMSRAVSQAKGHKDVFDKIYAKVKAFHDNKQLNVTNYDALVNDANLAQTNAQASIDTLSSLDVTVDCSSETVATSVAAFQQAVKNTRDSLKAYRSAIGDVIKAAKTAAQSANSTNNESDQ